MPQGSAKVTVICPDDALAAGIRAADRESRLKEVITEAKRAVYEHDPAIYVHVPIPLDLRPLPKDAPPLARMERSIRTEAGHSGTPWFEPPLGEQVGNLRDAIREGYVLAVVFVEYLRFTQLFWKMRQVPGYDTEGYSENVAEGLLPVCDMLKPRFFVADQSPPDAVLQPTPEARSWMEAVQPLFDIPVRAKIMAGCIGFPIGSPEVVKAVEERTAELYSHVNTVHPTRCHGPIPVRIEPLLRNPVGDWLGCAVRIGQGAVLVLPQCRDDEAKAALVVKLATEQWAAVQKWLASSPKPAQAPVPPAPPSAPPAGAASASPGPADKHGETALASVSDDAKMSASALAELFSVPAEALRKRLDRLREHDHTCFTQVAEGSQREPQYLYHVGKVRHVIEAMKASDKTSGKRPTRKKTS